QAHVRDGDLRQNAAVDVFDQRVHGGLRMHRDLDRGGRQVEEAAGLDDLQTLVEQRGGIDGDAPAHDPGGVFEGLLDGDVREVVQRQVAERASGGGEPEPPDLALFARPHALVDG